MKFDNFNKIGGTEFRVKNQINGYISFATWFIEAEEKTDAKFKEWTRNSGIYDYGEDQINRLNMVLKSAERRYKVIKKDDTGNYVLNFNFNHAKDDILNLLTSTEGLVKRNDIETCLAFKETLNFMLDHSELTDAKRIFHAFATYEQGDDFEQLYNENNLFDKIAIGLVPDGEGQRAIQKNCYVKKPQSIRSICTKIIHNKQECIITQPEFETAKKTYLFNFDNYREFNDFVHQQSYDAIARLIIKNSKMSNLNGDYFDLFNRVLWGFNLSPSTGKNVLNYLNNNVFMKDDGTYSITRQEVPSLYPYSLEDVNRILNMVQQRDFSFMDNDSHLFCIPRSDIAEYFVNLKFCYLKNITPINCRRNIHTRLDNGLYPLSHATGGEADMSYLTSDRLYTIETTIHTTVGQIKNHEFNPCCQHLINHSPDRPNNTLILVQYLDSDPELVRYFNDHGRLEFHRANKNFTLKTFDFREFSELNTID